MLVNSWKRTTLLLLSKGFPVVFQKYDNGVRTPLFFLSFASAEYLLHSLQNQSELCVLFVFAIFMKIYLKKVVRFIEIFITLFSNRHIVK
jgi:hypothetical protein